ncbi:unnamed protein product [Durusdinium trenchii]|uniref:Calmodulin-lysine N-methyltransferase n=1 Tax=Durusdinium trenchii TaxID=1381693 RepID=A0ABP0PW42_9DINO
MEISSDEDEDEDEALEKRVRDAAAETLVTWALLPNTADARHRFDDHGSDYLICDVAGRRIRVAQNRARQGELGVTGCCVWDAAVVLARYLEWADDLRVSRTKTQATATVLDAVRGLRCLELGAGSSCHLSHTNKEPGCGLAGLAAAALGGLVTLTDRDETLFLLERNARNFAAEHCQDHRPRRSGKMSAAVGTEATCCSPPCARHLDWSEPLELDHPETPFQVILAADCLYSLEGAAALAAVVNALCCEPESAAFGAKVLLSQELRAPEVLESFLEKVIRAFRVSRLPSPPTLEQAAPCVMLYRLQPRCTH